MRRHLLKRCVMAIDSDSSNGQGLLIRLALDRNFDYLVFLLGNQEIFVGGHGSWPLTQTHLMVKGA